MAEAGSKGSIVVPVGVATVQIRPIGFALYAEEFLLAGNALPDHSQAKGNTKFSPVPYYMYCRAIELGLKAYLLTKGITLDELKTKKYGHNLEALWTSAKMRGLLDILQVVGPTFETDLNNANAYYNGKAFEYFDFGKWAHGYQDLPPLAGFRTESQRITETIKKHCLAVC